MRHIDFWSRAQGLYRARAALMFSRRPFQVRSPQPLISFTFDDFPRSALLTGGAILKRFGLQATYYAAFGLMGQNTAVGPIFVPEDLRLLIEEGHELGCHTFAHCHAWSTNTRTFEDSIIENRLALNSLVPNATFQAFSYPIGAPKPGNKRIAARHFACCRGGGQTFNSGTADLNCLSAYFLEQSRNCPVAVKDIIERNRKARGWLILATHDVCENPTRFGCTPEFFTQIVEYAVHSGSRILPVVQALEVLGSPTSENDCPM